jgi:hypothetical protein
MFVSSKKNNFTGKVKIMVCRKNVDNFLLTFKQR